MLLSIFLLHIGRAELAYFSLVTLVVAWMQSHADRGLDLPDGLRYSAHKVRQVRD